MKTEIWPVPILNLTVTDIGDAVDEVSLMNLGLQIRDQSGTVFFRAWRVL